MSDQPAAAGVSAPPAPAAVPPPPDPATPPAQPTVGRLTGIEIQNYRAYRGTFRLDLPKGENFLIYGENGSGKSSLFHSLREFLEAPDLQVLEPTTSNPWRTRPLEIRDNRHRFSPDSESPGIKLEFGTQSFEWTLTKNDTGQDSLRRLNQGKGFLDYIALLGVHYVQRAENGEKDLFPLLIKNLLPHYTYPHQGQNRTFQERWNYLNDKVERRWTWDTAETEFKAELTEFNEALETTVRDLGVRASKMLDTFGEDFSMQFKYVRGEFKRNNKRIDGTKILAIPAFRKLSLIDYPVFLNEARLSALAICLFFAALKESPAFGHRLLVLDDILIGLDMTNRVKIIDLVRDNFKDWQIIILTYSKAWFERLKVHVKEPGWSGDWKSVVLWEEWHGEETSPRIVAEGSGDLIETAKDHLKRKDYTAAAVYARKAFEKLCHEVCAKASLFVLHVASAKDRKVEHYWSVLKPRLAEIVDETRRAKALELAARLEQAREFVLNRNAHFDVEEEDTLSGEVSAAIEAVQRLADFLAAQPWENAGFQTGRKLSPAENLSAQLAASRAAASQGALRQCRAAMSDAHNAFWKVYGARMGALQPIGAELAAAAIWKLAREQNRIPADVEPRLEKAKPYLFGCVKKPKFDLTQFEEAAKLLEELTAPAP